MINEESAAVAVVPLDLSASGTQGSAHVDDEPAVHAAQNRVRIAGLEDSDEDTLAGVRSAAVGVAGGAPSRPRIAGLDDSDEDVPAAVSSGARMSSGIPRPSSGHVPAYGFDDSDDDLLAAGGYGAAVGFAVGHSVPSRSRILGLDDSDSDAPALGRGATAACEDSGEDALVEFDPSGAGFGKRVRARGSKRRRNREEDTVPENVWKRFTPAAVDSTKCLARMWSGGRGGQCKCLPIAGRSVCAMHSKSTSHGLVTGAITYDKLQEFLKAEESA